MNYDYSNKFLGVFEYKTLIPSCIFGVILSIIIAKFCTNLQLGIMLFILIFLPIFLLVNTKIFNEPLLSFLICILKHYMFSGKFVK